MLATEVGRDEQHRVGFSLVSSPDERLIWRRDAVVRVVQVWVDGTSAEYLRKTCSQAFPLPQRLDESLIQQQQAYDPI